MFVHLVTGAALPDEGVVSIAGRDTRAISTDTEWLRSLDQFGIRHATSRAARDAQRGCESGPAADLVDRADGRRMYAPA
jgi:hypothetical protein